MADKTVNARLKNKADTSENWAKATSFVPLAGELIFYTDLNKVKMGDGKTAVSSLPFFSSDADFNIENGSATGSAQMKQDGTSGTFDFTGKNPNATTLDDSLTGDIQYGAVGAYSASFGGKSQASGKRSFACGTTTIAKGAYSFASGDNSVALGADSHAEGSTTTAYGDRSHAEGYNTLSKNFNSHAEGESTTASGHSSHSEGSSTTASGEVSHAEGSSTVASGRASHAGGESTQAKGERSFAHGNACVVDEAAKNGVAFGYNTVAMSNNEVAIGQYNNTYTKPGYTYNSMFSVGIGTSIQNRKNAFTVLSDGRAKVTTSPTDDDDVVRKAELDKLVKLTSDEKSWVDDTKLYLTGSPDLGQIDLKSLTVCHGLVTSNVENDSAFRASDGYIEAKKFISNLSNDAAFIATSGYIETNTCKCLKIAGLMTNIPLVREEYETQKSVFGSSENGALIMGNTDRPRYSKDGSDFNGVELALKSDIPSHFNQYMYLENPNLTIEGHLTMALIRFAIHGNGEAYDTLNDFIEDYGDVEIPATGEYNGNPIVSVIFINDGISGIIMHIKYCDSTAYSYSETYLTFNEDWKFTSYSNNY